MQQHSTVVPDRFGCRIGVSWWTVFRILDGRESSVASDNELKSCIQTAGDENRQLTARCECVRCEIDILARAIERSASRDSVSMKHRSKRRARPSHRLSVSQRLWQRRLPVIPSETGHHQIAPRAGGFRVNKV